MRMSIRRTALIGAILALVASMPLTLGAQDKKKEEKRSKVEQKEVEAMLKAVDAVADGDKPAPNDFPLTLEQQNFMRNIDGKTFAPITLRIEPGAVEAGRAREEPGIALPADLFDDGQHRGLDVPCRRGHARPQGPGLICRVVHNMDVHFHAASPITAKSLENILS